MSKVGRHENFSSIKVSNFADAISDILDDYMDSVYEATEEGLAAAEKVLVGELKKATPEKTGKFAKGWRGTGKKYKLMRFVGNEVTVKGKNGKEISLANIFEYSVIRGRPFIKATYENNLDKIYTAAVAAIKRGV